MPGYFVENFGCRATQADGAALERQFQELGVHRAASAASASIVVLNTCTVTAAADHDARAAIRRMKRQNPQASVVVTGCYAQRAPKEIAALEGVSCVVGNSHKHQLARIAVRGDISPSNSFVPVEVLQCTPGAKAAIPGAGGIAALKALRHPTSPTSNLSARDSTPIFISDIFAHTELVAAPVFDAANERTRPNLKIQDGCDNRCSFCVIPYVRGQSRSMDATRVIREVNALVEAGYREVVLSGINLGRWGRDLAVSSQPSAFSGSRRLAALISGILAETAIEKLRISSVEPMDWNDELITLVASSPRIAKHAHVPLQSGSDAVLRRMHRKYRPWHYREKIEKIHRAMLDAAIGADVMVGFPGETDGEFEATRRLIAELPFTYLHVFTYSARPGTPAAERSGQIPAPAACERNRILRELAVEKKLAFMRSFIGREVEAITLRTSGPGFAEALTDNYLKLRLRGENAPNRWVTARVDGVVDGVLVGCHIG